MPDKILRVPLEFSIPEPDEVAFLDDEAAHLAYRVVDAPGDQPVLRGRHLLEPVLDLQAYRATAALDWIELAFQTEQKHQAKNIQRRLKRLIGHMDDDPSLWVQGLDRKKNYVGTCFIVLIQEAKRARVELVRDCLKASYSIKPRPDGDLFLISGIEIAVDFTPQLPKDAPAVTRAIARWRMSELLRKHIRVDPRYLGAFEDLPQARYDVPASLTRQRRAENRKILMLTLDKAKVAIPRRQRKDLEILPILSALKKTNHFKAPLDATFYIGRKNGEHGLRLQDKTTDKRSKENFILLDRADRRSRIEIWRKVRGIDEANLLTTPGCLGGNVDTLEDLPLFKFEGIRKADFDFAKPTLGAGSSACGVDDLEAEVFRRTGAFGLDQLQRAQSELALQIWKMTPRRQREARPSSIRKKGLAQAYDGMNRKVTDALRGLTREWRR